VGSIDPATKTPMPKVAIFGISFMTKPFTTVARFARTSPPLSS
jgi:hypothetical protein